MTRTAPIEAVAVVIPANDEESLIGECLDAVHDAVERLLRLRPGIRVTTTVILDACSDRTREIVEVRPGVGAVEVDYRSVGASRAHGCAGAVSTAGVDPARLWIANTDADSRVPVEWLADQVRQAESGERLLLGAIEPDPRDLTEEKYRAWSERRATAEASLHVHGANLGVRADAYLESGGFPLVSEHEDVMLVERLAEVGVIARRMTGADVVTSARTIGRTPGGFAAYVRNNY